MIFKFALVAAVLAQDCFKQDEVNAATSLPWQLSNVDGVLVST
jgi:hypothetical protein